MKLIICRGLPGSGKTTKALEWLAEDPTTRARVNRDDLRAMIYNGVWLGQEGEELIRKARDRMIDLFLHSGRSVVCDDTNLSPKAFNDFEKTAYYAGVETEVWDLTDVPLEECIRRDAARERSVGEDVIRTMHEKWLATDHI
jgi:predicted kinase